MKNTVKSISTICFFFILLSCDNRPLSQAERFTYSGKFSYIGYADDMIAEGYIRDGLETAEIDSLVKVD